MIIKIDNFFQSFYKYFLKFIFEIETKIRTINKNHLSFRYVQQIVGLHQLHWARRWVVLQELPRPQVRTQRIRFWRWCRLSVHGHRSTIHRRRPNVSFNTLLTFYITLSYPAATQSQYRLRNWSQYLPSLRITFAWRSDK